ncbi:hypothetical protein AKJ09_01185 [Labilithrix luteola]|uniref:Uncharacterized protein n=1 Tax=Labilithrix luteola TaxID=1391654 RepID=A0A0K1PM93_9BACT|nr:hypothetical protein AKJ09_01185 [Labilithrix luteola]
MGRGAPCCVGRLDAEHPVAGGRGVEPIERQPIRRCRRRPSEGGGSKQSGNAFRDSLQTHVAARHSKRYAMHESPKKKGVRRYERRGSASARPFDMPRGHIVASRVRDRRRGSRLEVRRTSVPDPDDLRAVAATG